MILTLALASALSLPIQVDGEGYLRFVRDGRIVYSTSATLTVATGVLGDRGLPLTPAVHVPASTVRLEVDLSGNIAAVTASGRNVCGRLVLARFESRPIEERGYFVSQTRAGLGSPGEGTFGVIRSANSAPAQTARTGASVSVRQVTEAQGDWVTLKDIAAIDADPATKAAVEAIAICAAPPIGVEIPITETRIKALIKRAGLEAKVTVPLGSVVRRKFQAIPQENFVAVAVTAAQANLGVAIAFTCSDQTQMDFKAPVGLAELKPESVVPSGTTMVVTVGVYVEGKRVNSRTVNLKADASAQVRPGTAVKIVMMSAGISVEVPGRTRTGGMLGQTVTVETETGGVLSGIVIGANKIEVKI